MTLENSTIFCTPPSDSPLSVAASWIGITTFITTTLGGLTIFYTLYNTFEQAQEDILEYGKAVSRSSRELLSDIEAMEPMLKRSAHGHRLLAKTMELVLQIRELTNKLDAAIKLGTPKSKGIGKIIGIYKLGRNRELPNTMKEIQRIVPSLQAMKMNLILM